MRFVQHDNLATLELGLVEKLQDDFEERTSSTGADKPVVCQSRVGHRRTLWSVCQHSLRISQINNGQLTLSESTLWWLSNSVVRSLDSNPLVAIPFAQEALQ